METHIVEQTHKLLIKNKKNIAVAESCTGGEVSNLLTGISGSSQYFILGVVVYSNRAKETVLKVPSYFISKYGAVSKEAACFMAKKIRKIAKADLGIGITGIAGPAGGSKEKPVGTVFIAIDTQNKKVCKRFHFRGNRLSIREKAALKVLDLLTSLLTKCNV